MLSMKLIDTNDEGLRTLIHDYPKVIAKFTSANCTICDLLAPPFEKFAAEPAYQDIAFLRLDSDQNPVAKKMMVERIAPFFVIYYKGRMLECDTLKTEEEVKAYLTRLLAYVPQSVV